MSADDINEKVDYKKKEPGCLNNLLLYENYYSRQHEDVWKMGKVVEIQLAIDKCKESILALKETSEEKRLLVQRLVKLRLRLQEVQELEIYTDPKQVKVVQNHKFICQTVTQLKFHASQIYCETCSGLIWIPVQSCFACLECEYISHGQCLNSVKRICASVIVKENPTYILEICPEKGLGNQNYRCAECKAGILFNTTLNQPLLCDYSGHYFCSECHWGSLSVIPSRVVLNWDFQGYPVSKGSKQYLNLMMKKSILNLESINPKLFSFVEELAYVKQLRSNFMIMKEYILACKEALEAKLLRLLEDRQHFVENSDYYSVQDLIDIYNKDMLSYLDPIHSQFFRHITQDCLGCRGKGHVCRLCGQLPEVFPFEVSVSQCENCRSVFHRHCFEKKGVACPKCSKDKCVN
ncbi:differentially expressed in FDCP 8 homolog isoform X1 [Daphnia magna]|uniref:Differentially expressed in FDCP 8 n=1 Tax=Daphnia magna TaxID=35525 RepID=A0A164LB07_9CRUS|nr:differentially expressed in FDCP 8 homolog isoform X1 [Daphnia magna]KZS03952.1 Differentially expressed in FDCP 8 [Daphnia magna]